MSLRPSLLSLIILIGAPLTLALSWGGVVSPGAKPIIAGEWQQAFEKNFDKELALRDAALTVWGVTQYVLFKEGRDGVLVGDAGWLYSSEEFTQSPDAQVQTQHKLKLIQDIQRQLAAQNISLIIALIPDKSRVYPEFLGRYKKPQALENRYHEFRAALERAGLIAPDLLAALTAGKAIEPMFLRTDTHWTPAGAQRAAEALAAHAPALKGSVNFSTTRAATPIAHKGDLLNFIPLGSLAARFNLDSEPLFEQTTTSTASDSGDLFGEVAIAGALVGTSYSANEKWNFLGALQQAFAQDFVNVATDGKGPITPMQDYLHGVNFKTNPPQFIVWDIPERFLGVSYPAAQDK